MFVIGRINTPYPWYTVFCNLWMVNFRTCTFCGLCKHWEDPRDVYAHTHTQYTIPGRLNLCHFKLMDHINILPTVCLMCTIYIFFLEEDVNLCVVLGMSGVTSESVRHHTRVIP
jgi:hypothetical protein